MTREQAQEILLLYRLGISTDADPELAEALRLAEADPELAKWLEQHRQFHTTVATQLRNIQPPADLPAKILAGAKNQKARTPFLRHEQIWAMAAGVVLLIAAAGFWMSRNNEDRPTFSNFHSRMTSFALRAYQMDVVTNNAAVVRQYLAQHGAPSDFALTPGLEKLPVKGGGSLTWQNQPVAMMCFSLTNKQTAFMFVVDERSLQKPVQKFETTAARSFSTVTWSKDGKIYLLAAAERPEILAALAGP